MGRLRGSANLYYHPRYDTFHIGMSRARACLLPFSLKQKWNRGRGRSQPVHAGKGLLHVACEWSGNLFCKNGFLGLQMVQFECPRVLHPLPPFTFGVHYGLSFFLHAVEGDTPQWTPKVNDTRGVWPWGIQIGPFGVQETYFCKVNFHFINRPDAAFPFSCILWNGHPTM